MENTRLSVQELGNRLSNLKKIRIIRRGDHFLLFQVRPNDINIEIDSDGTIGLQKPRTTINLESIVSLHNQGLQIVKDILNKELKLPPLSPNIVDIYIFGGNKKEDINIYRQEIAKFAGHLLGNYHIDTAYKRDLIAVHLNKNYNAGEMAPIRV